MNLFKKISSLKKYGVFDSFKSRLDKYGLIKNYIQVQYPYTGITMSVRSHQLPFWDKLMKGQWESHSLHFLSNHVKKGDTILDVGSWIGPYTLFFSNLIGANGKVFAFEPSKKAYNTMLDNVKINDLSNVVVINMAITDYVGEIIFRTYDEGGTMSSIIRYDNNGKKDIEMKNKKLSSFLARTTTIDEFCKKNNVSPNGIKIDVEGAENLVLLGGEKTIKNCEPWLFIEVHGHLMTEKSEDFFWKKLKTLSKKIIYIEGTDERYECFDEIKKRPHGRSLICAL